MTDEQPKSASKKLSNPIDGSSAMAPEMSLDFTRAPKPLSKAMPVPIEPEEGEFSAEEPLHNLQQVTSIKYRSIEHPNHKLRVAFGAIAGTLLLLGLLVGVPYYLIRTDRAINTAAKNSIKSLQKALEKRGLGNKTKAYAERLILNIKMHDAPGSNAAAAKAWRDMDCKFLIQEALSRRFRGQLEPVGQYYLTDCQLAQDLPQPALKQLAENYGDAAQFQRGGDSWEMLPMQLLSAEAQHRADSFNRVAPKSYPNCRRWVQNPACVLKYVDQARQPIRSRFDDALVVLKPALKSQAPVLQAWLSVATAWNFMKMGDGNQVEQNLREAAQLFPALYDPFLEREIFRLRLMNAFRSKDKKQAAQLWKNRPAALMSSDEAGFWDTSLLRALTLKPEKSAAALDEFFSHAESYQRFRFDPLFIRIVVEQAIRARKSAAALAYIDRIMEQHDADKVADSEWLPMLRTRLLLAQKNGLEALQTLQTVEKYVVRSQELGHLKGTAMMLAYTTKPYRLQAAAEFQKAANLDPRGEHFFALFVSFLDAQEPAKAEAALKFWLKQRSRPNEEAWRAFAQGLLLYAQGKQAAAIQYWGDLALRQPGFELLKPLLTNLREDPKYLQDQLVIKLGTMLPVDGPLSPLAVFQ